jgi:hypothetical protein
VVKQRNTGGISFNDRLLAAVTQMRLTYERRENCLSDHTVLDAEKAGSTQVDRDCA